VTAEQKATGKAAAGKAAAARAERKPKAKSLTFKGLKFKLPPELPDTFIFDVIEIEAAGESAGPIFRMLRSILGPEQFTELRNAVQSKAIAADDIDDFVSAVFEKYGLDLGESSASQDS
jgi:hypothetical protein